MQNQHDHFRVLARAGARTLTAEEITHVNGSGVCDTDTCGRPTSTFSRDATGQIVDVTQD